MNYKQGEITEVVGPALLAVGAVAKNAAVAVKKKLVGDKKSEKQKVKPIGTDTVEDNMKYTQGTIEEGPLGNIIATAKGKLKTRKAVGKGQAGAIERLHSAEAKEKGTDAYQDKKLATKLKSKADKIAKRDKKEAASGKRPGVLKRLVRKVTGQSTQAGERARNLHRVSQSAAHKSGRKEGYEKDRTPSQRKPGLQADNMNYDKATYISEAGVQSAQRKLKGAVKAYKNGNLDAKGVMTAVTRVNNKRASSKDRLARRDAAKAAKDDS